MVFDTGKQRNRSETPPTSACTCSASALQRLARDIDSVESTFSLTFIRPVNAENGADYRIRTDDLPLTRRLLYQLS